VRVSDGNSRVILLRLKAKTGLLLHADKEACLDILRECKDYAPAKPKHKPACELTKMQSSALTLFLERKLLSDIARTLGITHRTALHHITLGKERLGLAGLHGDTLRAELAKVLPGSGEKPKVTMDDPAFN